MVDRERWLTLANLHREGGLTPAEEERLAAILAGTPSLFEELQELLVLNRHLRLEPGAEVPAEAFSRALREWLRADERGPGIRRRVIELLRGDRDPARLRRVLPGGPA